MSNAKYNALLSIAVTLLSLAFILGIVANANAAVSHHPTCATINNTTNTAAWRSNGRLHTAHYSDFGGDHLLFDRPVPRAVRLAEAKLANSDFIGPQIARACT